MFGKKIPPFSEKTIKTEEMALKYRGDNGRTSETLISMGGLKGYHYGFDYDKLSFENEAGVPIELKVPRVRWTVFHVYSGDTIIEHDLNYLSKGDSYKIKVQEESKSRLWGRVKSTKYKPVPRKHDTKICGTCLVDRNAYLEGSRLYEEISRENSSSCTHESYEEYLLKMEKDMPQELVQSKEYRVARTEIPDGCLGHAAQIEEIAGLHRAKEYLRIVTNINRLAAQTAKDLDLEWGDFWGYGDVKKDPVMKVYHSLASGDLREAWAYEKAYQKAIDDFKDAFRNKVLQGDDMNKVFHEQFFGESIKNLPPLN